MEIERKFIVKELPSLVMSCKSAQLEQSYISITPEIRIRKEDDSFYLTHKGEGTLCREEDEKSITSAEYYNLLDKTVTYPVIKTRYFVPLQGGYCAEVDIYHGSHDGLITVEVEFSSIEESEKFDPPFWFDKEITEDRKYKNKSLAKPKFC